MVCIPVTLWWEPGSICREKWARWILNEQQPLHITSVWTRAHFMEQSPESQCLNCPCFVTPHQRPRDKRLWGSEPAALKEQCIVSGIQEQSNWNVSKFHHFAEIFPGFKIISWQKNIFKCPGISSTFWKCIFQTCLIETFRLFSLVHLKKNSINYLQFQTFSTEGFVNFVPATVSSSGFDQSAAALISLQRTQVHEHKTQNQMWCLFN